MKLILVLPAAGLLFSGAMSLDKMSQSPLILSEKTAVVDPAPRMWANSRKIYKGETLQLHFTTPHPQYLGVIDPNGHFFYVIFPEENGNGNLKPYVSSEKFEHLKTLKINTSKFKADPYTYGVMKNERVFTRSGYYRFLLGDNLHMDDADAVTILKVKYVHSARPLPVATEIAVID